MKAPLALLWISMSACGGPILEDGTYDVRMTITTDTCGGLGSVDIEWEIERRGEGEWRLEAPDGTDYEGDETEDGEIAFDDTSSDAFNGCLITVTDTLVLEPDDDGKGFDGTATSLATACDGSSCGGIWSIEGELDE